MAKDSSSQDTLRRTKSLGNNVASAFSSYGSSGGNPWAALGGALYGLGYSFKDDLGLKDSNFFTQMLFPLGMGDGGGLKINGKSVLDIL